MKLIFVDFVPVRCLQVLCGLCVYSFTVAKQLPETASLSIYIEARAQCEAYYRFIDLYSLFYGPQSPIVLRFRWNEPNTRRRMGRGTLMMILDMMARQLKRPSGFLGYLTSKTLDVKNRPAIDWVYSLLDVNDGENILEIGYGSGILIDILASLEKKIRVYGVDFSTVMYRRASRRNASHIRNGRVALACGDILEYDPGDVKFQKIIAINVVYFWNDLPTACRKLCDLLSPAGRIYIYMADPDTLNRQKVGTTSSFNTYPVEHVMNELTDADCSSVSYRTKTVAGYRTYCIISEK